MIPFEIFIDKIIERFSKDEEESNKEEKEDKKSDKKAKGDKKVDVDNLSNNGEGGGSMDFLRGNNNGIFIYKKNELLNENPNDIITSKNQ